MDVVESVAGCDVRRYSDFEKQRCFPLVGDLLVVGGCAIEVLKGDRVVGLLAFAESLFSSYLFAP